MPSQQTSRPEANIAPIPNDISGLITLVTAGSLIVYLRRDIGLNLVRIRVFLLGLGLLALSPKWFQGYLPNVPVTAFAVLTMALILIHRVRHGVKVAMGSPQWHTYEAGKPLLLGFLPLPRCLVCGLLEPAAGFALGLYLYRRSDDTQLLGTWLMLSGATLFMLEARMRGRRRRRILGFGDAVIESEDLARRAQNFGRPQSGVFEALRRRREAREQQQRRRQEELEARSRQQKHEQERQERERSEREQREQEAREAWRDPTAGRMTPEQALEILELKTGATEQDIRAAYNRLMQKVHPDMGGSTFFAKQLNLARDTLLKPQRKHS